MMALADASIFFLVWLGILWAGLQDWSIVGSVGFMLLLPPTILVYWRCYRLAPVFLSNSASLPWALKQGGVTGAIVGLIVIVVLLIGSGLQVRDLASFEVTIYIASGVSYCVLVFVASGAATAVLLYFVNARLGRFLSENKVATSGRNSSP